MIKLPLIKRAGFTLPELLIAVLILMVGMMALLSAATAAIRLHLDNILRDEAVQIADARMRVVKGNTASTYAVPFQNISMTSIRMSKLRSKSTPYTVTLSSFPTGGNANILRVLVSWNFRNKTKRHELMTLKTY